MVVYIVASGSADDLAFPEPRGTALRANCHARDDKRDIEYVSVEMRRACE